MQASCVALSESRRLFLRSLSLVDRRSLWPHKFQSRDNFSSPARHDSLYLYELLRRLDNRVSSSTALSEARRIFLRYLSLYIVKCTSYTDIAIFSLNWNYGMCSARYKIAASCTTRLARSRSPTRRMHGIVGERERSNCVVDMRCI